MRSVNYAFWYIGGVAGELSGARKVHSICTTLSTLHIYLETARLTVNKNGPDLSQGETPETTTKLGLDLMATIKKTADKRSVPPFPIPPFATPLWFLSALYAVRDFKVLQNSTAPAY
jgi:ribose/xylose/arabinose/galactoside ABC-type transport system permease subunit